jgi:alpha-tubulin suppressor-like RCC1 family protein
MKTKVWAIGAAVGVAAALSVVQPVSAFTRIGEIVGTPITQIAASELNTCALTTAGAVQCWGDNSDGNLGNGGTVGSISPVDVSDLSSGVTAIAYGGYHGCALKVDGTVMCWGDNFSGQLGDGSTTDNSIPVAVVGLSAGVAAITLGFNHSCALLATGGVQCWGFGHKGQLGNGSMTNSSTPVDVTGLLGTVIAISSNDDFSCALNDVGAVQCWGSNLFGGLGNGTTTDSATPVAVTGLSSGVAAIAVGDYHACALMKSGDMQCWGSNENGQLGNGTTTDSLTPVSVSLTGANEITANGEHTCALINDGTAKCWGLDRYGELGDGAPTIQSTPDNVFGLSGAASIVSGGNHTCAVSKAGGLRCWGYNNAGQLGDGSTTDSPVPTIAIGTTQGDSYMPISAVSMAAGGNHSCLINTDGTLQCWGSNGSGELGNNKTANSYIPVSVLLPNAATAVANGGIHTCAVTSIGHVLCWGANSFGQLGDGTTTERHNPLSVLITDDFGRNVPLVGATKVGVGGNHSCVVLNDTRAACWGANTYGQIGNHNFTDPYLSVAEMVVSPSDAPLENVSTIAGGENDTCALLTSGDVKCWGDNGYGQLGNGIAATRTTGPDVTVESTTAQAIAVGGFHGCALTTSKTVRCWGNNTFGQLGDGTTTNRNTPVDVVGLSNIVAITAGGEHSCALTSAGAVFCWGNGNFNQLGEASIGSSSVPVPITGLSSHVSAVSSGYYHTCATTDRGSVQCWGENGAEQLGDATDTVTSPRLVSAIRAGAAINFAPPIEVAKAAVITLHATSTSDFPVSFYTWTPSTCSLLDNVLTITGEGLCGVSAYHTGVNDIAAAPEQQRLIRINPDLIFANGFE